MRSLKTYHSTKVVCKRWHDLTAKSYRVRFNASEGDYPTAMLHFSISGLPYEDHVDVRLNNVPVEFSIPPYSRGGNDRAWVRVNMAQGLQEYGNRSQEYQFDVRLTKKGRNAEETQGGKMLTSVQIIEYGSEDKCVSSYYGPQRNPTDEQISQV
jgi:hypothetical protein